MKKMMLLTLFLSDMTSNVSVIFERDCSERKVSVSFERDKSEMKECECIVTENWRKW